MSSICTYRSFWSPREVFSFVSCHDGFPVQNRFRVACRGIIKVSSASRISCIDMAILDQLKVGVKSGGAILQEYDVPLDELAGGDHSSTPTPTPRIVRYLEAISGAEYKVETSLTPGFDFGEADYLSCSIFIDGKRMTSSRLKKTLYEKGNEYTSSSSHGNYATVDGVWQKFPLCWGKLLTSKSCCQAHVFASNCLQAKRRQISYWTS